MAKSKTTFHNRFPQFQMKMDKMFDNVLRRMSADIVTEAKLNVPLKDGRLISSINYRKASQKTYEVYSDTEYSAYQERGMRADGSHVVRRYTTPGTGKHWLRNGAKEVASQVRSYFKMWSK